MAMTVTAATVVTAVAAAASPVAGTQQQQELQYQRGRPVLGKRIVSCRFFTISAQSAERVAFCSFFYDFPARSAEKKLGIFFGAKLRKSVWTPLSARSAENEL